MRTPFRSALLAGGLILVSAPACAGQQQPAAPSAHQTHAGHAALQAAIDAPSRAAANKVRDAHRHPMETLAFFGVEPDDTVVELWPGGGWYTEVLAPYLAGGGALWTVASQRGLGSIEKLKAANPAVYGDIRTAAYAPETGVAIPPASVDVVLTFRNVHNWAMADKPFAADLFKQAYAMLKPGGVLGVVEHRLPEDRDAADEKDSGYMKVSTVRALAEGAGFTFAEASEVNANPKDTADHPEGVWTLPPTLRLKDVDREKYVAIGESDRMTLKFVKPAG